MSKICSNPRCRTTIPDVANYCIICGFAVSPMAIEKRKIETNVIRNKKLDDAAVEIFSLNTKLLGLQKNKEALELELINADAEKKTLKAQINNEIQKKGMNSNQKQYLILPKWVFMIFCIMGIVFLILLSVNRSE